MNHVTSTVPSGVQVVADDAAPSGRAAALAASFLRGEGAIDQAVASVAEHFLTYDRVDGFVCALTMGRPQDPAGWTHLGQRAWLREWVRPGSPCSVVPEPDAGPEAALTMPWISPRARTSVVVLSDAEDLPEQAAVDRRELASNAVRGFLVVAQQVDGTMFGSVSLVSASPGSWPEVLVADFRLLTAALAARMHVDHATRSTAEAIALSDQARATQQQFFATIGHELRTPVAAILGFAEVMGEDAKAATEEKGDFASGVEHDSGVIIRAAEQLHDIIEDLLSTGRTLGQEDARTDIDLNAAVADVIHWHRTPAAARDVAVVSKVEEGVTAQARASGLRQVLTNLIGNAIIHNPPGGLVEITAERTLAEARDPRVRVKVRDHGNGLTPDELARVFDPFVRFAEAEVKGTGLGLSLARAVAERDGGLVGAESTPGEGSVFWVDLPASAG